MRLYTRAKTGTASFIDSGDGIRSKTAQLAPSTVWTPKRTMVRNVIIQLKVVLCRDSVITLHEKVGNSRWWGLRLFKHDWDGARMRSDTYAVQRRKQ